MELYGFLLPLLYWLYPVWKTTSSKLFGDDLSLTTSSPEELVKTTPWVTSTSRVTTTRKAREGMQNHLHAIANIFLHINLCESGQWLRTGHQA